MRSADAASAVESWRFENTSNEKTKRRTITQVWMNVCIAQF